MIFGSSNATRLRGRNISIAAHADTNVLAWDAATSSWKPAAGGGGGGGSPGSPDLSVQGNSGGVFVGIPNFKFNPTSGFIALGSDAGSPGTGGPVLLIDEIITGGSPARVTEFDGYFVPASDNQTIFSNGNYVNLAGSRPVAQLAQEEIYIDRRSTATVTDIIGANGFIWDEPDSSADTTRASHFVSEYWRTGAGVTGIHRDFYAKTPTLSAGSITTDIGVDVEARTGADKIGLRLADRLQMTPVAFASLPAAAAGLAGAVFPVTDSTTAVWGATITGGGANPVLAYCNGTNWTVAGK